MRSGRGNAREQSAYPVSEELDVLHNVGNEDKILESTDCVDVHVRVNEGHCRDLLVLKLPDVYLNRMGREVEGDGGEMKGGGEGRGKTLLGAVHTFWQTQPSSCPSTASRAVTGLFSSFEPTS